MVSRHYILGFLALLILVGGLVTPDSVHGPDLTAANIKLIEPIDGNEELEVQPGVGTALEYFNRAANWLVMVAVGICLIWMVYSGILIMVSGSNSGLRQQGQDHMMWAITGLVMLLFAGFILRTLNSYFYV